MIKNYFTIAWRNIVRHKAYSIINILGLSLGICACIVIYLVTDHEFSFDRFHPDSDRIYRITGGLKRMNGEREFLNSPFKELARIEKEVRGFESKAAIQFWEAPVTIPSIPGKRVDARKIILTEPEYFEIFRYKWLAGNPSSALKDPFKVVLTESEATLYFGQLSPDEVINKTLVYQDSLSLTVSGVIKDWNERSDVAYTDFISLTTAPISFLRNEIPTADWQSLHPHRSMAFVKLAKNITSRQVNAQLEEIRKNIKPSDFGSLQSLQLQSIKDIHFSNDYYRPDDGDGFRKAHLPTLYILIALSIFILAIAAMNFINLSTAQSIQRAKEVGIRKVMGGSRSSLVLQFLSEAFLLTAFAVLLSVMFVKPILSLFASYVPKEVRFEVTEPGTLLFLLIITVFTALLAGFYPAKVLSGYLPVISLKGEQTYKGSKGAITRKALIVFQFSMSLIFIIGTLVVRNQITYMTEKDKGFSTDAILTINSWTDNHERLKLLNDKINSLSGVEKAILQGTAPMGFGEISGMLSYKGAQEISIEVNRKIGDEAFIPFYGMKLVAGRNLAPSDSLKEYIINESYARALGFSNSADAVGKFLFAGSKAYPIVGVVANFHLGSFRSEIKPAVIEHSPEWQRNIAVRLSSKGRNTEQVTATLANIEALWKEFFPNEGFSYAFLDESISWLFEKEKQTAWLMNISLSITIFISCMGLFGLAMFMAKKRTKEIGIRKVLGASVMDIASMISRDFVKLVGLSVIIASPIAYFVMSEWLQDYAFRTTISWWVFALSAMIAIGIALVTVSFQAVKAAMANPVKSLRIE